MEEKSKIREQLCKIIHAEMCGCFGEEKMVMQGEETSWARLANAIIQSQCLRVSIVEPVYRIEFYAGDGILPFYVFDQSGSRPLARFSNSDDAQSYINSKEPK